MLPDLANKTHPCSALCQRLCVCFMTQSAVVAKWVLHYLFYRKIIANFWTLIHQRIGSFTYIITLTHKSVTALILDEEINAQKDLKLAQDHLQLISSRSRILIYKGKNTSGYISFNFSKWKLLFHAKAGNKESLGFIFLVSRIHLIFSQMVMCFCSVCLRFR